MTSLSALGPGTLALQTLILFLTLIQTIGVLVILWKLNISFKDILSMSSLVVKKGEDTAFLTAEEQSPLNKEEPKYGGV